MWIKKISLLTSCLLSINLFCPVFLQARPSGITAPILESPGFTMEVPTNMPSSFENLSEKYTANKNELKEQGWGTNNYKDGLANKLEPPKGFGETTAVDVFNGVYGDSVKNENWADFGSSLYSEDKFNAQKELVANSYVDYSKKYTPLATAGTLSQVAQGNLSVSSKYSSISGKMQNIATENSLRHTDIKNEISDKLSSYGSNGDTASGLNGFKDYISNRKLLSKDNSMGYGKKTAAVFGGAAAISAGVASAHLVAGASALGSALTGAAAGAATGSVVPIVGTLVGLAVGVVAGLFVYNHVK